MLTLLTSIFRTCMPALVPVVAAHGFYSHMTDAGRPSDTSAAIGDGTDHAACSCDGNRVEPVLYLCEAAVGPSGGA